MNINNLKIYIGASLILTTMSFTSCKMENEDLNDSLITEVESSHYINSQVNKENSSIENNKFLDIDALTEKINKLLDLQKQLKDIAKENTNKSVTISFTGDCTLGTYAKSQYKYFDILFEQQQDYDYYFKNVKEIFSNDDYTVVNLEGPLTDATIYQSDKPFAFKGKEEYVNILSCGSVEAANLSNNHIFDYYSEGYNDTVNALTKNDIAYFDNNTFHIEEIKGMKFGFAGFKAFNLYTKTEIDKALKYFEENEVDIKIISLHGGIEYDYDFDSIKQELAHYAIDNGADLIIGHHPHILQGVEEYNGKYILYSLGNFCYGGHNNPPDKNALVAQVTFSYTEDKNKKYDLKLIPISISSVDYQNNFQPTTLKGEQKDKVLKFINEHSQNFDYKE